MRKHISKMHEGQKIFVAFVVLFLSLFLLHNFHEAQRYALVTKCPMAAGATLNQTLLTSPTTPNQSEIHINGFERFATTYQQRGYLFNESGAWLELSVTMTSALIHDFTPYVGREAARRFVDPAGGHVFHVMSPAMTHHDGR